MGINSSKPITILWFMQPIYSERMFPEQHLNSLIYFDLKLNWQRYTRFVGTKCQNSINSISLQISMSDAERSNLTHIYNPMTIRELQGNYSFVNWLEYFQVYLQNLTHIDPNETIIVVDKNYLQRLGSLIASTPNRIIANYFAWRLVLFSSYLLNGELGDRRRHHFKTQPSTPSTRFAECTMRTMKL